MKIATLEQLETAAAEKRSVIAPGWKAPRPAAVVLNLPGRELTKLFAAGLELYTTKRPN